MTRSPRRYRDNDRARLMRGIHGACRKLGLDNDARHDVQASVTGKASMRDMDGRDLIRLLAHLNRLQGRKRRTGRTERGRGGQNRPAAYPLAPRADLRLIHALWGELGRKGVLERPGRAGLNAFIRSRFGDHWAFVPIDVDALADTGSITDVIRALKAMLARAETRADARAETRAEENC